VLDLVRLVRAGWVVGRGCDEGAARVETSCVWLGTGVGFWDAGWGVVSSQPFASLAR